MRNTMLAMLVLAAAGAATIVGSGPAAAVDYPYCVQGMGVCRHSRRLLLHILWSMYGVRVRARPLL